MAYVYQEIGGGSSSAITNSVLSDFNSTYDAEGMGEHIVSFENLMQTYNDLTAKIDDLVVNTLGVDGLKGEYGNSLLKIYDDLVGDFAGFAENYEVLNEVLMVTDSLNTELSNSIASLYQNGGGSGTASPSTPTPSTPSTPTTPTTPTKKPQYKKPTIPGGDVHYVALS